jgi:CRP-like cAMP-binding protein
MSERIWYLKRADLFQSMSVEELELLESRCRARSFPRGSVIYAPQDAADGVLLLAAGRAKVYTITDEGKQAILAFIEPGEIFGELAVVDQEGREDYAEALENAAVVLIPKQAILDLMDTRPQVSLAITKLMGLRRRRLERRLKSLMFRSTRDRLIHALLELAEEYGDITEEGIALRIRLSHQDLANLIGSTRESVTLTLGELLLEKYLRVGRRRILLTDAKRLANSLGMATPWLRAERAAVSSQ